MKVKIKQILKMIIEVPKRLLNKIIDKESVRVNEINRNIFDGSPDKGGED